MKFDLKLFVLVGILAGLRDVWGTAVDNFIVAELKDDQKKEVDAAVKERRVIKAVYKPEGVGQCAIIDGFFKDKLFSIVVWNGSDGEILKPESFGDNLPNLFLNMSQNVKYTVYLIFKEEFFVSVDEHLLLNSTASMFGSCKNLIHADLSNFNTTKVTDMSYMFYKCFALEKLNLSNFDTTSVTDMSYMFYECTSLTELNLSSFDTQNVTNMTRMFVSCTALTDLNLVSFRTTNVTDMSSMFYDCAALTKLDLSYFDTTNVTDMSCMFVHCMVLTELNVSTFDTRKVTNMSGMFAWCEVLKKLNLSNFDFSNVGDMENIFFGCNFENLYLPKKHAKTRKRCICCGDRYVYIKGEMVVGLGPNNVKFEDIRNYRVGDNTYNLV